MIAGQETDRTYSTAHVAHTGHHSVKTVL